MEQQLKLVQHFSAKTDSETRTITFLANSGKQMASGETVDLETLTVRHPQTGELVAVKELTNDEEQNWIPLLKDHMPSIDYKVGQVRRMWVDDEGLQMVAKIANTEDGDRIYQLAKDDMLDTFSITVAYTEEPENGVIRNSQLLETSVVWLGNDETTRLKSVNEKKEENMPAKSSNELTVDEAQSLKDKIAELEEQVNALTEANGEEEPDQTEEPVESSENEAEEAETPAEAEKETETKEENSMDDEIQKATNARGARVVNVSSNSKKYLDTKEAMRDFATAITNNHGNRNGALREWSRILKKNGIEGDFLPTPIEQIFFKTWTDNDSILSTFRHTSVAGLYLYAFTGEGEGIRAKGHKKGETKADQELTTLGREVLQKAIYKKLPIDLQTIVDDGTGEILRFRTEELASRVANEIAVGAILGDGRSEPASGSADYRVYADGRGLYSMASDIAGSATAGSYAEAVATEITADSADTARDMGIKALGAVRTAGQKILVLPFGTITDLLLLKDTTGRPLYETGVFDPSVIFGQNVRVFEMDEMADSDYKAIAYAANEYVLIGDSNDRVFTQFDLNTNNDVMLVERFVGGSLQGRKTAAGVKSA